jgi:hypothetical protein
VLTAWSGASIVTGTALLAAGRTPFVRAVGIQALAWGAIDGAIAAFAWKGVHDDARRVEDAAHWDEKRKKLRTIVAVNVALDVLYVAAGAALLAWGKKDEVRGAGAGILPQGAFLLAFDAALVFGL